VREALERQQSGSVNGLEDREQSEDDDDEAGQENPNTKPIASQPLMLI